MARRRQSVQDSLDLLLDTICNTFGGVLFIAIMVILLLQQTSPRRSSGNNGLVSRHESQVMINEFKNLQQELVSLRQTTESQDALLSRFSSPELARLVKVKDALQKKQRGLEATLDDQYVELLEGRKRSEALHEKHARREDEINSAKHLLERSRDELKQEVFRRTEPSKSPIQRSSGNKQEVGFVMRYGRLYLWHRYNSLGERLGLNTDDFVIISSTGAERITSPHPFKGLDLAGDASTGEIRRILNNFDPTRHIITVVVRPDSYGRFCCVRDAIVELKFDYRLMPMNEDSPVADRGGSRSNVQ